jgi:hypothetical protein
MQKTLMNYEMHEKVAEVCTFQEAVFKNLPGHLEELTKQCQSVMKDLADVKLSKKCTEAQLREKKSEVIAVINRANAKPCESICTERI